jgi:replicative DNA helicase
MNHIETERVVIGGLIMDPVKIIDVAGILKTTDFASENAMVCYGTMLSLFKESTPITLETVSQKIGSDKITWLANCTDVGSAAALKHNAKVVSENARCRRIALKLDQAQKDIDTFGSKEVLDDLLKIYKAELAENEKKTDIISVAKRFSSLQKKNKTRGSFGIPTQIPFLENLYIQYVPGHLWMIGAYTSTGKTAFMVHAVCEMIRDNSPKIMIISTEMTEEQLFARMLAHETGFNANVILSGNLHTSCADKEQEKKNFLKSKKIDIIDFVKTIEQVENRIHQKKMQDGVDIVFIDFIQNIKKYGCRSKYEESSEIAISLQNLAKDTRCTIVCLSQITANVHKENKDTVEYKGAGELGEACDIGLWLRRNKEDPKKLLVEARKNRHGPRGDCVMAYDDNFTSLQEIMTAEG